ncbi:hypothetical protein ACFQX6_59865 [Streptosporangium lutulentum]
MIDPGGPDGRRHQAGGARARSAALIRRSQLLTDAAGMEAVARWTAAVSEADGIFRIRLSPGVDVCELVTEVRGRGHRVSPNHVLMGQPLYFGGPASRPFPASPSRRPSPARAA